MRGSVKKAPNGTYYVVYDAGKQPRHVCTASGCGWGAWATAGPPPPRCRRCDGPVETVMRRRQIRKRGFTRKTGKGGADTWLAEQIRSVERGSHVDPSKETLREFVEEVWLPALRVSPNTFKHYEEVMRCRVLPALGEVLIQRIDVPRVDTMLKDLEERGGRYGKGLSPKSVLHAYYTLNAALNAARAWDHVSRNILERVDPPKVPHREMSVWSADQMRSFLEWLEAQPEVAPEVLNGMQRLPRVAQGRRLLPMWSLAMTTGMRREELLGLRWSDIDWETGTISIDWAFAEGKKWQFIYKRPKTNPKARDNASQRKLAIDHRTLAVLRAWRTRQMEERLRAGANWVDDLRHRFEYPDGEPTQLDLVFRDVDGDVLEPRRISDIFPVLAKQSPLPRITLHDVRHSYATMMLLSGVHPKIVSQRLGHATVAITLDLYSWVLPSVDGEAAERGAELLFESKPSTWLRRCAECRTVTPTTYQSATEALLAKTACPACGCEEAVVFEDEDGTSGAVME